MHDHDNARGAAGVRTSPRTPTGRPRGPQVTAGNAAVVQMLRQAGHPWAQERNDPATPEVPVQRLVSQITPGDEGTVGAVNVVGRPESPYTGTMGDHSTAYVVQVRAITERLRGRPPGEAAAQVLGLVDEVRRLPGFQLLDSLPPERRTRLMEAQQTVMGRARSLADGRVPEATQMLELQSLVGDFLHFRELVPLSTMNVRAVAPAEAGKGKGESGPSQVLALHVINNGGTDPEALRRAIVGLLDVSGVALVATQHDGEQLSSLAPGLTPAQQPLQRAELIVQQHLMSIETAYPGVVVSAYGDGDEAMRSVLTHVVVEIEERKERNRNSYREKVNSFDDQIRQRLGNLVISQGTTRAWEEEALANVRTLRRQAAAGLEANDGTAPPEPVSAVMTGTRTRRPPERYGSTVASSGSFMTDVVMEEPPATTVDAPEEEAAQAMEAKQPLASQISMDASGTITAFDSAGRSPSPFSGTMGAHTTAWVVHVDAVRRAVLGENVDSALAGLFELTRQAHLTQSTMAAHFPVDIPHQEKLNESYSTLLRVGEQTTSAPEQTKVLHLQGVINALLTYLNYIPGATLLATNTGGRGEGTLRNRLLGHEHNRTPLHQADLLDALLGLLDLEEASPGQRTVLMEQHLRNVTHAYPTCVGDSGITRIALPQLISMWEQRSQAS
ncbi:hypothetical protein [Streptomyces sp. WAC01280]|uniref:hypothetical protein n=1 Tax=Streptomyces sp. WAC01280 TaxID=2487424 RepID=UPI000F78CC5C|nr:hypothetical protein [Streptomyces sp. WAC01280]RSS59941.1 hypothetical protein EF909_08810 [Streptomyces sp. WAC01280]